MQDNSQEGVSSNSIKPLSLQYCYHTFPWACIEGEKTFGIVIEIPCNYFPQADLKQSKCCSCLLSVEKNELNRECVTLLEEETTKIVLLLGSISKRYLHLLPTSEVIQMKQNYCWTHRRYIATSEVCLN